MLLCGATDRLRGQLVEYRSTAQGFYQATPEDVKSKGEDFPRRLKDYFRLADKLTLHWQLIGHNFKNYDAVKAATFENGTMTVHHKKALKEFASHCDDTLYRDYLAGDKSKPHQSFDDIANSYADSFKQRYGGQRFYGRKL